MELSYAYRFIGVDGPSKDLLIGHLDATSLSCRQYFKNKRLFIVTEEINENTDITKLSEISKNINTIKQDIFVSP